MTAPSAPDGIRFALEGIDEITFAKVLRDLMKDPAFARPLQVQAQLPTLKPAAAGTLTLVFAPEDRSRAGFCACTATMMSCGIWPVPLK